jgi:hypothetical protein
VPPVRIPRPRTLIIALLGGVILLPGCGGTEIDAKKAEGAIRFDVQTATDTKIESVDCPSGVEVVPKARFSCQVHAADGSEAVAELEILNDEADVRVIRLTKA